MNETNRPIPGGKYVLVEFEDGIAWVMFNRPEKRNAMTPAMNEEMQRVLQALETDERCRCLVLTGAGESFSAGMDLKEYFRDIEHLSRPELLQIRRAAYQWQWRHLQHFYRPTIAMVNGWCFGGAFTPLVSCDLSIAAEEAILGLSEINWGIIPAGNVTRAVAAKMRQSDALYYIMTGQSFDGRKAAQMGLVNEAVPRERLRDRVRELARELMSKNPTMLHAAKEAYRAAVLMDWDTSEDYINAKVEQANYADREHGMQEGIRQFLDEKSFKPGLGGYRRDDPS